MLNNLNIRKANEGDFPMLQVLYKELGDEKLNKDDLSRMFEKINSYPDCTIYIAEEDGKAIGTFLLLILDTMAHGNPSALIEDVAVSKDCQGKGIGKAMMQFAMEKCKEKNCYKVALSSMFKREAAHKFYESLGFEKMGFSFVIAPSYLQLKSLAQ